MKIADISIILAVTPENSDAVLLGLTALFQCGAVTSTVHKEPAPEEAEEAPAKPAGRRGGRKAAEAQKPAEPAAEPAAEPDAEPDAAAKSEETAEPAPGNVWEQPAAPEAEAAPAEEEGPLTLEKVNDLLSIFAGVHGVATTRRVIQSFGVTRLSELAEARWPELLAALVKENGGKPLS